MLDMDKNIPWGILHNYLRSDRRNIDAELLKWVNEDGENKEIFDELVLLNELAGELPAIFSPNTNQAWSNIEDRIKPAKSSQKFVSNIRKVAAMIVLLIVGYSISLLNKTEVKNQNTKIESPKGSKTQVLLPDSSLVILNGGSHLVYSDNFLDNRNVNLKGEAVFNVNKHEGKQFMVHTDHIDVQVHGTKFNVKAYDVDSEVEISLLEGLVGLSKSERKITSLEPGQIVVFDKSSGKIAKYGTNVEKIMSWSYDELIFEDKTFMEIVTYLERWYGVEIELSNDLGQEHRYTFSVKTESLRELLDLINVITPIRYEINGAKVKIDNR